jgi:hypothetical protein
MPRAIGKLSAERIRELAKTSAEALLRELRADIVAIERTFPELATPGGRRATMQEVKKRTQQMSAAAKKAVSLRMKKYWAERRAANKKR